MSNFADSYVGRLRALVGHRILLMPGARIVIERDDGKILLQLRSDFGVWGLPGGMPEPGDSITETIIREVKEETGLTINSCQPFGFGSDPGRETFTYPNGDKAQHFVLNFYTSAFSGTPVVDPAVDPAVDPVVYNEETLQLEWYNPAELPDMLPNMMRSVEAYLEFKHTGVFQIF